MQKYTVIILQLKFRLNTGVTEIFQHFTNTRKLLTNSNISSSTNTSKSFKLSLILFNALISGNIISCVRILSVFKYKYHIIIHFLKILNE